MVQQAFVTQTNVDEQTWRLLWTHVAARVLSACPSTHAYEPISTGIGYGLRQRTEPGRAILLHPAGQNREVGDLTLTVLGSGTHVIPRAGRDFARYVEDVTDIFETTAANYFAA